MLNTSHISNINPISLTCNYLENPLGVDTPTPRLSWKLQSDERGQYQTGYRILVSSSTEKLNNNQGDLWDSGKIISCDSIHIPYEGKSLLPRQTCFWKVCVWDKHGKISNWSNQGCWEMGLLSPKDWKAKWIGNRKNRDGLPAPMFRQEFTLEKQVTKARAYICGLGYYDFYINGDRVGDIVLDPGFTQYDKTVLYQTYDITKELTLGENAIGIILGDGWYNCFTEEVWNFRQAPWRDHPKLLLQIHLQLEDGEERVITSDSKWRTSTGPIIFNALRNGEFYDARLEKKGWSQSTYNDNDWQHAVITSSPGGILKSQQMTPIRIKETITPVSMTEVKKGVFVYDIGQNISGWVRLKVSGSEGSTVTIKYSERLKQDGDIEQHDIDKYVLSGEFQTDKYTLKGEGIEIWEPRFTYHGFQYIQLTGYPTVPLIDSIEACVVHTDFDTRGEFECSNELLNKIQKCARWSTLTNYHSIPTDCPHREKNGWTGDAQLSAEQVLLNFNPMTAYTKWMYDFIDAQRLSGQLPGIIPTGGWGFSWGPAWDSSVILIPWYMYTYCGDVQILEDMYEPMKKYVDYVETMAEDYIVEFGSGDWCPPKGQRHIKKSSAALTNTAYYYVDTHLLSKIATILGNTEDANYYSELSKAIRKAVREKFIDFDNGCVGDNGQTSLACVLYQGLVDESEETLLLQSLVDEVERCEKHIDCGILGSKYVMHTLTELGRADLAYEIATQVTFPGWGHLIMQGATTLWEDWMGNESLNHHMFSDISAWFYKGLAGINPDAERPGFKHIIIKPNPVGDLMWVKAWHESMYGKIKCNWNRIGEKINLDVTIPTNCTATVYIPGTCIENVLESGNNIHDVSGITYEKIEEDYMVLTVESGTYSFSSAINNSKI